VRAGGQKQKRAGRYLTGWRSGGRRPRPSNDEQRARRAPVARPCVAIAGLLATGLVACGSASQGPAVVEVGQTTIGKASVSHWTRVVQLGGTVGRLHGEQHGSPQQRAVAFLISSRWLTEEARREGFSAPDSAVGHALAERKEANGAVIFEEELHATGQTVSDVKLEIGVELALEAIRHRLASQTINVTPAEATTFYTTHRQQFVIPELREVDLIERLASPAAANALVRSIGSGPRFAKRALHEKVKRKLEGSVPATKRAVVEAIFSARTGQVSRPMRLGTGWTVFVVRKVIPAKLTPFAKVQVEITQFLRAQRRREALARFEREYTARWTARTSCRPGYVVQGCKQYSGSRVAEEDPFAEG
jgi:hypothetical protein